jgi:integrase
MVPFERFLREEKRLAPTNIRSKLKLIKYLNKRVNLWDHEEVERYAVNADMTNGHKNIVLYAYQDWCKFNGFEHIPKKFKRVKKLPYIPPEKEIDQLIAGTRRKTSTLLQLLKESAFRPIEAWRITTRDIDLEKSNMLHQ